MATVTGKIKWFDVRKGYGFVTTDAGEDVYVHFSGIVKGRHYTGLNDGDQVTFEIGEGKKGTQAENVQLVSVKKEASEKKEAPTPAETN